MLRGGHFRVISVTRCRCVSLLNLKQAYCTHPSTTCVQYACSQLFSKPVSRLLISQTVYIMFNANKMKGNLDIRRTQIFWKVYVCRLSIFARKPQHDNICYMRKIHVQYQNIFPFYCLQLCFSTKQGTKKKHHSPCARYMWLCLGWYTSKHVWNIWRFLAIAGSAHMALCLHVTNSQNKAILHIVYKNMCIYLAPAYIRIMN